jgi:hypothetical protein
VKKLMVLFMLIAMTGVANPPADEESEPVWGNEEYSYEAEIAWGSKTDLQWVQVPVVWTQIVAQTVPDHFYGIVVLGTSRRAYWAGETLNSTPENPELVRIGIEVPPIPNGKWWGFYRVRFRPFPVIDPTGWSETSRWVTVIDLNAFPIIGPFSATPEGE